MVRMHMVNVTSAGNTAANFPSFYSTFSSQNCGNTGDIYLSLRNSIIILISMTFEAGPLAPMI